MKIALTFDDGPDSCTTRILNTLQLHEGRVSFFVLGSKVADNRGKIFRAWQMGCDVLCHAWDHQHFIQLPKSAIKKQLLSTTEAIAAITGDVPRIFRPPYGEYNEKVEKVSRKLGFSMVNWTVSPEDWDHKDADKVYSVIMSEAKDGDVVLCHDVYDSTVEAMSRIIPELIEKGFELVTVSEMIRYKYGEPEPGKMYFDV